MGCFYLYCPRQDAWPVLTEKDNQRVEKKRQGDEMRRQYIEEKSYAVAQMWECERLKIYKTVESEKEHLRDSFPYSRQLRQGQLLDKIKSSALFGYLQCDIKAPEHLCKFPAIIQKYKCM